MCFHKDSQYALRKILLDKLMETEKFKQLLRIRYQISTIV